MNNQDFMFGPGIGLHVGALSKHRLCHLRGIQWEHAIYEAGDQPPPALSRAPMWGDRLRVQTGPGKPVPIIRTASCFNTSTVAMHRLGRCILPPPYMNRTPPGSLFFEHPGTIHLGDVKGNVTSRPTPHLGKPTPGVTPSSRGARTCLRKLPDLDERLHSSLKLGGRNGRPSSFQSQPGHVGRESSPADIHPGIVP